MRCPAGKDDVVAKQNSESPGGEYHDYMPDDLLWRLCQDNKEDMGGVVDDVTE